MANKWPDILGRRLNRNRMFTQTLTVTQSLNGVNVN